MNGDMYPRILLIFQIYYLLVDDFHFWLDSVLPPMSMSVSTRRMTMSRMRSMRMTMSMMHMMTTA
jgi:hypothetical protein